jgi:AGCS family alanine or glycine:cation symporter
MDQFAKWIQDAADVMFMPYTVCILLATGLFFTLRTGFVQVRRLPEAFRTMVATQQSGAGGALSPFQAFMTGLAATIGTGNIAGVATAIISGGPGALFWIWIYGSLAAAVKFSEAVLGLRFRIPHGEQTLSGPMYYLRDGLKQAPRGAFSVVALFVCMLASILLLPDAVAAPVMTKLAVPRWVVEVSVGLLLWLAVLPLGGSTTVATTVTNAVSPGLAWLYAFIAGVAVLLTTPFTQPNSIAVILNKQIENHTKGLGEVALGGSSMNLNRLAIGVVLAVLTWLVIVGGVKSIGRVAEKLSPLKVGLYLIGGLIVIVTHLERLPEVLRLVTHEAFSRDACLGTAKGAAVWMALRYGMARGAYANEAGYGTAAVVYGTAKSNRPDQQGLNAVMEVFIITFITCTISALTILLTDTWKDAAFSDEAPAAVAAAFNKSMPGIGGWMVAFSVFLFGYTTLIGWSFYGEQYLEYMFGRWIVTPYRWVYCLLIPLGAVLKVNLVWAWGDILNGSQIFPNLVGLFALSGIAAAYAWRKSANRDADASPTLES